MMRPSVVSCFLLLLSFIPASGCASVWARQDATRHEVSATVSNPAEARWTVTTVESASTPAQKKVLRHARLQTLTGEVVDVSCYLQLGKRGEAHIPCGQKCVRNGQPIGLLTDRGKLYLVIPEEHHPRRDGEASLVERFAELMAQRVRVTGMVTRDRNYRAIFVRAMPEKE